MKNKDLLIVIMLLLSLSSYAAETMYIGNANMVDMHMAPDNEATVLRELQQGDQITVLQTTTEGGYALIRTSSGDQGWVLTDNLVSVRPLPLKEQVIRVSNDLPVPDVKTGVATQEPIKPLKRSEANPILEAAKAINMAGKDKSYQLVATATAQRFSQSEYLLLTGAGILLFGLIIGFLLGVRLK